MKKRILIMVIISFSILCLPVMPVMAEERTTPDGGLTLHIPSGYNAYTQDELKEAELEGYINGKEFVEDTFLENFESEHPVISFFGELLSDAIANDKAEEDVTGAFGEAELLITNELGKDECYVYYAANNVPSLTNWPYYRIREELFGDGKGINAFLTYAGWPFNPEDAIIVEPADEGMPYLEISGTSSDSSKCYRLTVLLCNGYEYMMILTYNGSEIPESTILAYDGIINSASIAHSTNAPEPGLKYQDILKQRVELTD